MSNYRGNSPDYMRRPNCGCSSQAPKPSCQAPSYQMPADPSCTRKDDPLADMTIAMAYVPWQVWRCPYEAEKGFQCGTIFEDLNKPFKGTGGMGR